MAFDPIVFIFAFCFGFLVVYFIAAAIIGTGNRK
jgi:phage shock protein PspC (stress-responsive transcriptional regulator)